MIDARELSDLVSSFRGDGKSRELVLQLLEHTTAPFSRKQYQPGHVTCTGLVLHPAEDAFVLVYHRRLNRWLLPGGHVEPEDSKIWDTARREVREETGAQLSDAPPKLIGIDVHAIPPNRREPFHLHHDLIFGLRAVSSEIAPVEEVRQAVWCSLDEFDRYDLPLSIRLCAGRGLEIS